MQLPVTDVELLKKKARKLTAGRVLMGENASVCLEMGQMNGCRALIAAGFGALSSGPQAVPHDRLLYILDGHVDIYDPGDDVSTVRQGECTVLAAGKAFRLVFPHLAIYLLVEPVASA